MFVLGYLILVFVAAVPLAMTVLQRRGDPPSLALMHRIYRDVAYVAVAILAIIVFRETIFRISLENYWFAELGQQYRFWFTLGLRVAIFTTVLVFGGLFIAFNLRLASRHTWRACREARLRIAGFLASALVASGEPLGLWTPLTAFLGTDRPRA